MNSLPGKPCLAGTSHAIVLVLDRQRGASSQSDVAHRFISGRKPEGLYLLVFMMNCALLRPERRVLGRFSFDADDRKVGSINPYFATVDVLALGFRVDLQNILPTRLRRLVPHQFEVVVVTIQ